MKCMPPVFTVCLLFSFFFPLKIVDVMMHYIYLDTDVEIKWLQVTFFSLMGFALGFILTKQNLVSVTVLAWIWEYILNGKCWMIWVSGLNGSHSHPIRVFF